MKRFLATLLILVSVFGLCACAPAQESKFFGTWVDEVGNHVLVLEEEGNTLKAYLNDGSVYEWSMVEQPKVEFRQPRYEVLYDTIQFFLISDGTETITPPIIDITDSETEAEPEATEAATDATEAEPEATEAATEATEAETEATEPATEATEPVTEATEPATEATEPVTETTETETEATEPAADATESEEETTEPEATEPEATEPEATEAEEEEKVPVMTAKLTIKKGMMTLVVVDADGRELFTLTKRY